MSDGSCLQPVRSAVDCAAIWHTGSPVASRRARAVTFDPAAAGGELFGYANALEIIADAREVWRTEIAPQFPEGLAGGIVYDSTEYIEGAIDEVVSTIVLALVIVVAVIYFFLGSVRSVLIPALAMPLSLAG